MTEPIVVAIVGAESTGKTALAEGLAARVTQETGLSATWVPEELRLWCEREGRTPLQHEQAGIAAAQARWIEEAALSHAVVIADTTPLMTAVYSRYVFDDNSLDANAAAWQRRCALTLLTALDLPWVPDGLQRDGPQVREPVDALLRELLITHRLPWALVGGHGPARVANALDALAPLLRQQAAPRRGLFTRLAERNAERNAERIAEDKPWTCELCDDPACEHLSRRLNNATPG